MTQAESTVPTEIQNHTAERAEKQTVDSGEAMDKRGQRSPSSIHNRGWKPLKPRCNPPPPLTPGQTKEAQEEP